MTKQEATVNQCSQSYSNNNGRAFLCANQLNRGATLNKARWQMTLGKEESSGDDTSESDLRVYVVWVGLWQLDPLLILQRATVPTKFPTKHQTLPQVCPENERQETQICCIPKLVQNRSEFLWPRLFFSLPSSSQRPVPTTTAGP